MAQADRYTGFQQNRVEEERRADQAMRPTSGQRAKYEATNNAVREAQQARLQAIRDQQAADREMRGSRTGGKVAGGIYPVPSTYVAPEEESILSNADPVTRGAYKSAFGEPLEPEYRDSEGNIILSDLQRMKDDRQRYMNEKIYSHRDQPEPIGPYRGYYPSEKDTNNTASYLDLTPPEMNNGSMLGNQRPESIGQEYGLNIFKGENTATGTGYDAYDSGSPNGIYSSYTPTGGIDSDLVRKQFEISEDRTPWQKFFLGSGPTYTFDEDGKWSRSYSTPGASTMLGALTSPANWLLSQVAHGDDWEYFWDNEVTPFFKGEKPELAQQAELEAGAKEAWSKGKSSKLETDKTYYTDAIKRLEEAGMTDSPSYSAMVTELAKIDEKLAALDQQWKEAYASTTYVPNMNYQPELAKDETNPLLPGSAMAVVGDDGQIQIVDSKTGEPIAMTAEEFFGGQGYEDLGYGQRGHIGENGEWITNDQAYYNRRLQEAFDKWSSEFGGKYRSLQEMMLKGTPEEFLQMYKYDPELFATAMVDTWGGDYDWLTYEALMQDGEMSLDILSKLIGERRGANSIDTLLQALRTGGVEGQAAFDLLSGPGGAFTDDLAMFLSDLGLGWSSQFDNSGDISSLLSTMSNEDYQAARAEADARNLWMLLASGGLGDEFDNQFLSDWFSTYYGMDTGNPLEGYTFDGLNPYLTGSEGDYRVTNAPTYGGLSFGYYNNPWTLGGSGDYSYVDSLPMAYLYDLLDSVGVYGPTSQEQ